ncbi:MAG: hypothetical protein HY675_24225 [Chloroflexi bacterium]|nr:hypothetical protein [Chloroflexota bacterium]
MYNTITIEQTGKPAAALCNEDFLRDARSAASGRGMPGVRIVSETVPPHCSVVSEIEAGVSAAIDDVVAALTQPLTLEEKSPKPEDGEEPSRIAFRGDLQEVNRFFYKRGWADGWPIVPPTEKAVAEMLTGTDLPSDHVIAKIIPRFGKATVGKIAVNAVMAGALPTYMPLLIAAIDALMDRRARFGTWEVSTGSWVPSWIVNGPARGDLHINSGSGALSPGDIANATIGRAMGLIIKNIGGARKGIEDMGVFGNPGKYTMVVGENEEQSPWEPLHVGHGFNKEDTTISVFFPNSFAQPQVYSLDHKVLLNAIIYNIAPGRGDGLTCIMLNPTHARTLAKNGWGKEDIAAFISEYARVPAYRHPNYYPVMHSSRYYYKQRPPLNAEETMSLIDEPERIRVIVAGGPGNQVSISIGGAAVCDWVTKKVQFPADWDGLVDKYRHIVPTYVRY